MFYNNYKANINVRTVKAATKLNNTNHTIKSMKQYLDKKKI